MADMYKHVKGTITEEGNTMFLQDAVLVLNTQRRKIQRLTKELKRFDGCVAVPVDVYNGVKQLLICCSFSHETEYDGRTYEICDLCDKQDGEHTDDCLSHTGDKIIAQFLTANEVNDGNKS